MRRIAVRVRKGLILTHRWLGVVLGLLVAIWFASAFVMMYWSYPRVDPADRLAKAEALNSGRIALSPEQALSRVNQSAKPSRVLLSTVDGRPVYRIFVGRSQKMVYADDGETPGDVPEAMARRIAVSWTGNLADAIRFEGVSYQADQWTVNGVFRAHGSLFKYSWPDGQEVYVSPVTAEVAQYTTRGSRTGAYFGAIPHWLYLAPLRRNAPLWNRVVVWSSGAATVVGILGMVIGIWKYSPFKRYRVRGGHSSFPYTGQKRWHAILGLVFGVFACTWVFSGMMSMDPFPAMVRSGDSPRIAQVLRSPLGSLAPFAAKHPRDVIVEAPELKTKELELLMIAGEPAYLAVEAPGRSRIVPVNGTPMEELASERLISIASKAGEPHQIQSVRRVTEYEAYYVDRHHRLPLPVLFVQLSDPGRSSYYIDPRTAMVVQSYDTTSRWNRWLYQGLHSIDLPWLYRHRPAWDIVVLTLLAGGSALCFTSLAIGWRVIRALL